MVLPERGLVADALAEVGVGIDPDTVPRAHYDAVRMLDSGRAGSYVGALCAALGVRETAAIEALRRVDDRARSGKVLWSEPTPGAVAAIVALRRAGTRVLIVSNSDGHAAENLGEAGILAATGLAAEAVIDSTVVGSAKPEPRIFEVALALAETRAGEAVHVGDMLSTDVAGAHAVGLTPIHIDPYRRCRRRDHLHVRSLAGLRWHIRRGASSRPATARATRRTP